jgi:predicted MFS family arabinose efflux permease
MLDHMTDARRLMLMRATRAFSYGFTSVLLGVHLQRVLHNPARAGVIITATLAGASALTLVAGRYGDRIGRRRMHVGLSLTMAGAMSVLAYTQSFPVMLLVALTGTVAATALEAGPFVALEQAMLAHAVTDERRTRAFARYNLTAALVGATGALAAGGPAALRPYLGGLPTQRFFLLPAALALVAALLGTRLSNDIETAERRPKPLERSRGVVVRLASLFALDSLGGGFVVTSLVSFWFRARFGTSEETLGLMFFGTGVLQAASFPIAARLADRIGLINTMVLTHLPSNVLLALVPFAGSETTAIALLLARFALSQMDVPTRQSYVVAVVDPAERTAAAGYTTVVRSAAQAVSPAIGGGAMGAASLGIPFYLAGGIKAVYDVALYVMFRRIRPPEEAARVTGNERSTPARRTTEP